MALSLVLLAGLASAPAAAAPMVTVSSPFNLAAHHFDPFFSQSDVTIVDFLDVPGHPWDATTTDFVPSGTNYWEDRIGGFVGLSGVTFGGGTTVDAYMSLDVFGTVPTPDPYLARFHWYPYAGSVPNGDPAFSTMRIGFAQTVTEARILLNDLNDLTDGTVVDLTVEALLGGVSVFQTQVFDDAVFANRENIGLALSGVPGGFDEVRLTTDYSFAGTTYNDTVVIESIAYQVATVDAPASAGLFALGLAGLGLAMRRRSAA